MATLRAGCILCAMTLAVACTQTIADQSVDPTPTPEQTPSPTPTPDTQDFGDGHHGELVVTEDTVVNPCAGINTWSSDSVVVDALNVTAGDRVIVIQMQQQFGTAGPTAPVTEANVGQWEITRVTANEGGIIDVDPPLANNYNISDARSAQICLIPEYTQVNVSAGGSIVSDPWDGSRGGFIGFYASESVVVEGAIDVSGAGFRPGMLGINNTTTVDVDAIGETEPFTLASGKGEGVDALSITFAGKGAMANGGGGGNAHNAGGGGGGNGGAGGQGGMQAAQVGALHDQTPGRGGGAVQSSEPVLILGGGGGSGHQNNDNAGVGGHGGGIIVLRVADLTGAGSIVADGETGEASVPDAANMIGPDGAGGGGAGGTIFLEVGDASFTGSVFARGGSGGHNYTEIDKHGPGGGGGGGVIYLSPAVETLAANVNGGFAGLTVNLGNDPYGAEPGETGVIADIPAP